MSVLGMKTNEDHVDDNPTALSSVGGIGVGASFMRVKIPQVPVELPGKETLEDSTLRSAKDRAEAAEYVQNMIEGSKVTLFNMAAIHTPIFNPDILRDRTYFDGIHAFEKAMDDFKALILGKSLLKD